MGTCNSTAGNADKQQAGNGGGKGSARVAPEAVAGDIAQNAANQVAGHAQEAWENVASPTATAAQQVARDATSAAQRAAAAQQQALDAANAEKKRVSGAAQAEAQRTEAALQAEQQRAKDAATAEVNRQAAAAQAATAEAAQSAENAARAEAQRVAAAGQATAQQAQDAAVSSANQHAAAAAGAANDATAAAAEQTRAVGDAVEEAAEELEDTTNDMDVMFTDRKRVNGQRCVVTIGQRKDGTGVMVRVFHPATEKQHELSLSHEQIRETLPDDLLGDENEIEQLKYIRDNLRLTGPEDSQHLELLPPDGPPLHVLLRDRRIIGGKTAHITIGMRDGFVVARAFNPASERERELQLTPGQLKALLPSHLHGDEHEVEQLHWISHNLHYVRARSGKVELKLVPPESKHFIPELTADDDDIQAEESDDEEGDLSTVMLFRNQVRIDNRRVFVTIARRHHALIIRALNPAAQQECELVLPGSQLKHLLPDELLQEENETEMLKHLANDLCWKPSNDSGHITLALRGELVNQHLQDEGDAKDEEGATAPSSDEHGDRAELSELMRDRRRINGLRVYLAIGRRAGELVVNVYSPSKEAEVELQLPLQRLMYVVPGYLLEESHEQDMVHYLADCVHVEEAGEGIKVSIKGAPPAVPRGTPDAVLTESLSINSVEHTVTAETHGNVLVIMAYHVELGTSVTITLDLRTLKTELGTGTARERELIASGSSEDLVVYLLSRLEYVKVPCGTKLEVAGVTGKGAIVDRGFSKSVVGQDDQYYILGLQRSTDGKSIDATAFNTENHTTLSKTIPLDDVATVLSSDPDGAALMKEVKTHELFEKVSDMIQFTGGDIVFAAKPAAADAESTP